MVIFRKKSPFFLICLFAASAACAMSYSAVLAGGATAGSSAAAFSFNFSKNLAYGASDPDVLYLQKLLDQDPRTTVAVGGPGAPGNESSFFGALTKAAVIKFQNIYASEVLYPAGLSSATGFVGAYTRAKLNTLSSASPGGIGSGSAAGNDLSPNPGQMTPQTSGMYVPLASPNGVFTPAELASFMIGQLTSLVGTTSGQALYANAPSTTVTPSGAVSQSSYDASPLHTPNAPQILSSSPSLSVAASSTITVTGANFTSHNNITSSFGTIPNVASPDGRTLTFSAAQFPHIGAFLQAGQAISAPVLFTISNENGTSQGAGILNMINR